MSFRPVQETARYSQSGKAVTTWPNQAEACVHRESITNILLRFQ